MIIPKNQPHLSTTDTSDKTMSDSLRAAQIIFQKHSDAGSAAAAPAGSPHKRNNSSQNTTAKSAVSALVNRAVTPPPTTASQNNFKSHPSSPPSDQAHLAAALAHALSNPETEEELNYTSPPDFNRLSPVTSKQRYLTPNQHISRLYRAPSSRNSSTGNVTSPNNDSVTSLEELPKLDVARDLAPIIKGTPTKQLPVSSQPKQMYKQPSEQSLQSTQARTSADPQRVQSLPPHRQSSDLAKHQLKENYRQPVEQTKQTMQVPHSPPRQPRIHKEMSLPSQLPTTPLHLQIQQQQQPQPQQQQPKQADDASLSLRPEVPPHVKSYPAFSGGAETQTSLISTPIANSEQQLDPSKPLSRDLPSRIPPPRIYLTSSGDDEGTIENVADNEVDIISDRPILRTRIKRRMKPPIDESSSSVMSSDSPGSYGMENSSWDDRRVDETNNYGEDIEEDDDYSDENNINEEDEDDYYDDYDDDEIDDEYNEKEFSLPPRADKLVYDRYDFPDTASLPNLENGSSSLLSAYSGGQPPDGAQLATRHKQPQPTRVYQNVGRVPQPPNVTYQGTLPDLIPHHMRRSKMEKLRSKIFGSRSGKKKPHSPFDFSSDKTSVTSDSEGRSVVKTNQNMRFKTTMRKEPYDSAHVDKQGHEKGGDNDEYGRIEYELEDSDIDSDSSVEPREEKRNKNRGKAIRKKLKHTAAVVPYSHHLPHMDTRHAPKVFNEDKPWKSHNDVGFVTSQERKRYEGMWVSNRCMYLDLLPWWAAVLDGDSDINVQLPEDGLMLNLVVKDIWGRSNLSSDLLVQIYDMVDTRRDGTLDRKSFVVGMWLVDQCLYGRKLPKEIDHKVWSSVDKYVVSTINTANRRHLDRSRKKLMKQEIKNIKKEIKNVHL